MIFKKKKSQAAIEFLMTYGWMLLVVLIVGALIFSFVDFGSLLPARVELSGNLLGMSTDSVAYATTDEVTIAFKYNGATKVELNITDATLIDVFNTQCDASYLRNSDTNDDSTDSVIFLTGNYGYIIFNCTGEIDLLRGDTIEGDVSIPIQNPRTDLTIPTSGSIRLNVQ